VILVDKLADMRSSMAAADAAAAIGCVFGVDFDFGSRSEYQAGSRRSR